MIGDAPATLVWLSPQPPDAAEAQALSSWARIHGVTLTQPRDERPAALAVHPAGADSIEDLLDRARDAIAARDADGIEHATAAAEALLRAHPELPQAAWLMAEVERSRSTRWRRGLPQDPEAAERAWLRAEALDGGRVPGIGELAAASHPAGAVIALGLPGDDAAWLDGRPVPPDLDPAETNGDRVRSVVTLAGPHALVVTAEGAPVWAGWVEVAVGRSALEIDAPATVPCSTADISSARLADEAVRARWVRCATWIAAAPGRQPGTLRIAQCDAGRCGLLRAWGEAPGWTRSSPPARAEDAARPAHHWPAWASWALAGAGVALAAGVVVVASGALQPAPTATRFVTGGLKEQ